MRKDYFWRGFTWKRFLLNTLFWFVVKISGELFFSFVDHTFYKVFTLSLIARNRNRVGRDGFLVLPLVRTSNG